MKRYHYYFYILSFMPIINFLILWCLILASYLKYNRFPSYNLPDPKEFSFLYYLFSTSMFVMILSLVTLPLLLIFNFKKLNNKLLLISIYVIGGIFLLILYRIEALGIGEWIMD